MKNKTKSIKKPDVVVSTETIAVISSEGTHEYNIIIESGDRYVNFKLYRSNSSIFTKPGEFLLSLVDDENGVVLNDYLDKTLGYDEITNVKVLLDFYYQYQKAAPISPKYNFYKQI